MDAENGAAALAAAPRVGTEAIDNSPALLAHECLCTHEVQSRNCSIFVLLIPDPGVFVNRLGPESEKVTAFPAIGATADPRQSNLSRRFRHSVDGAGSAEPRIHRPRSTPRNILRKETP